MIVLKDSGSQRWKHGGPPKTNVNIHFLNFLFILDQGWPDFFGRGPNLKTIFHRGPHYWK